MEEEVFGQAGDEAASFLARNRGVGPVRIRVQLSSSSRPAPHTNLIRRRSGKRTCRSRAGGFRSSGGGKKGDQPRASKDRQRGRGDHSQLAVGSGISFLLKGTVAAFRSFQDA